MDWIREDWAWVYFGFYLVLGLNGLRCNGFNSLGVDFVYSENSGTKAVNYEISFQGSYLNILKLLED